MMTYENKPTWELTAIVKALSLHPWLNNTEEKERLETCKRILKARKTCINRV